MINISGDSFPDMEENTWAVLQIAENTVGQ